MIILVVIAQNSVGASAVLSKSVSIQDFNIGMLAIIKNALISQPISQYPDFTKSFCITTDARKIASGAILSQDIMKFKCQLPTSHVHSPK